MAPSWLAPILGTLHPLIGVAGSSMIQGKHSMKWYDTQIKKPSWTPPNYLFPPVWTCLYASMGSYPELNTLHCVTFDLLHNSYTTWTTLLLSSPPSVRMVLPTWAPPVLASILPHFGGFGGAMITSKNVRTWYDTEIKKPWFRPPNWLFGPVWTALYTAMG
uniref:Peripheral-type benzodiazepine receptor n=1 Tax=Branchiostoma floridae TaxID=7739 RepID=C3ZQ45_BRAFL|eukprot:XP_002589413.1 hypothetical protein BRAFLDRAFT_77856 [Branchiostoma floridae]